MWAEFTKLFPTFTSAVLTGFDETGYPFSLRCQPQLDNERQVLTIPIPATLPIQPGAASLLLHSHDEQLWNLRSYMVRGQLQADNDAWFLRPEKFTPGAGMGGLLGFINFIRTSRRNANQYLQKRGLPRPKVPWDQINAAKSK
jgi:hypothetical protein